MVEETVQCSTPIIVTEEQIEKFWASTQTPPASPVVDDMITYASNPELKESEVVTILRSPSPVKPTQMSHEVSESNQGTPPTFCASLIVSPKKDHETHTQSPVIQCEPDNLAPSISMAHVEDDILSPRAAVATAQDIFTDPVLEISECHLTKKSQFFLKPAFHVIKHYPRKFNMRKHRTFEIDFFQRKIRMMDMNGAIRKEFNADALADIECRKDDTTRLTITFKSTHKNYELKFRNATERQHFYECAYAFRGNVRVFAPKLSGGLRSPAVIIHRRHSKKHDTVAQQVKVHLSPFPTETFTLWTGVSHFGGSKISIDNVQDMYTWMPKKDVDCVVMAFFEVRNTCTEDLKEWFQKCCDSQYMVAAVVRSLEVFLLVILSKKKLTKVNSFEESSLSYTCDPVKGAISLSFHIFDTSLCFVALQFPSSVKLWQQCSEEVFRNYCGVGDNEIPAWPDHMILLCNYIDWTIELSRTQVNDLIRKRNFAPILKNSHVRSFLNSEKLFADFKEPEVHFSPSFPLQPKPNTEIASPKMNVDEYESTASPAYGSAVMYRTFLGKNFLTCTKYNRGKYPVSDNTRQAPIFAQFKVLTRRPHLSCMERRSDALEETRSNVDLQENRNGITFYGSMNNETFRLYVPSVRLLNVNFENSDQTLANPPIRGASFSRMKESTRLQRMKMYCSISDLTRELEPMESASTDNNSPPCIGSWALGRKPMEKTNSLRKNKSLNNLGSWMQQGLKKSASTPNIFLENQNVINADVDYVDSFNADEDLLEVHRVTFIFEDIPALQREVNSAGAYNYAYANLPLKGLVKGKIGEHQVAVLDLYSFSRHVGQLEVKFLVNLE